MLINTSKTKISAKSFYKDKEIPFFFIHGFTGSYKSWLEIIDLLRKHSYAIDIPGHGNSKFKNLDESYNISDWCSEFYMTLYSLGINKINLCAYSMGGRLAIAFASKYPEKINSLILESANVGLEDEEERNSRYSLDREDAHSILKDLPSFMDSWNENKLFLNQKKRNKKTWEEQKEIRYNHNSQQLAKSLQSFSLGGMPYYETEFQEFSFPISIINGSEDEKYIKIGKEMTRMNQNATQYIIKDAMHNTHLEAPELFIDALKGTVYE